MATELIAEKTTNVMNLCGLEAGSKKTAAALALEQRVGV